MSDRKSFAYILSPVLIPFGAVLVLGTAATVVILAVRRKRRKAK